MTEWRKVHTRFWRDPEILDMTPEDKLFYLYLLTNANTTVCGCYELPSKITATELGYSLETVNQLIERFMQYGKIAYDYDTQEVLVLNWLKYNPPQNRAWAKKIYQRDVENIKSPRFRKAVNETANGTVEAPEQNYGTAITDSLRSNYGATTEQLRSNYGIDLDIDKDRDVDQNPMSGKPDAWPIIEHLNKLTGKQFRNSKASLKHLNARLRDGATPEDCRLVIEHKVAEWLHSDEMRQYLRPVTLFRSEKFDGYLMAARDWDKRGRPSGNGKRLRNALQTGTDYGVELEKIMGGK